MAEEGMYVSLKGIRLYARHGVANQERTVGNEFEVDLRVETDFSEAAEKDCLEGTVNYADLYRIVREEMAIPSQLIEHAAGRIMHRIFKEYPRIEAVQIRVAKLNPPIGALLDRAEVEISRRRRQHKKPQ